MPSSYARTRRRRGVLQRCNEHILRLGFDRYVKVVPDVEEVPVHEHGARRKGHGKPPPFRVFTRCRVLLRSCQPMTIASGSLPAGIMAFLMTSSMMIMAKIGSIFAPSAARLQVRM